MSNAGEGGGAAKRGPSRRRDGDGGGGAGAIRATPSAAGGRRGVHGSIPAADPAREVALRALLAVERGAEAGPALRRELDRVLDPRARALATELVYGVTRLRGALDMEIGQHCRTAIEALAPAVRAVLRLGAYQLRVLDRIPDYAAVGSSVTLVRRHVPAATGLVNAVLRHIAAAGRPQPAAAAAASLASHPAWLVQRWTERLGADEAAALCAADNRPLPVVLRTNPLRADRDGLLAEFAAMGVAATPGRWLPEAVYLGRGTVPAGLAALRQGRCSVQGEASMLVAHVADPAPGALCLDVAAGPGGKATHLAEWMGDQGTVVANDAAPWRAALVGQAAARLGLRALRVQVGDGRSLPGAWAGACDVVVADLPCSGLGTLATRADARWRKREADIFALSLVQRELLAAAALCVRPGGRLVYSTCTTEPEENEEIVAAFLADHPTFAPEDMRPRLPAGLVAATAGGGATLRLWPHHHGTEGFFVAALVREKAGR